MSEERPKRHWRPSGIVLILAIATGIVCGMMAILLDAGIILPF